MKAVIQRVLSASVNISGIEVWLIVMIFGGSVAVKVVGIVVVEVSLVVSVIAVVVENILVID